MHLHLVTAPTTEPVSTATVKAFLRVDGSSEDSLIDSLAKAAREKGEELSRRAFITQTWELVLECWPVDFKMKVYRPPLQSVSFVKYIDRSNIEHTWTDYVLDIHSQPGVIIFHTLPADSLRLSGPIQVQFVAGYGNAETNVPERIKNLILSLTAYWYENREMHEVPDDIKKGFVAERAVWF